MKPGTKINSREEFKFVPLGNDISAIQTTNGLSPPSAVVDGLKM
jgi:hypothetical protein